MAVCKFVERNGLAIMLASKWSAGVTPEVNLRIQLREGKKACKRGNPPWPEEMSPEI